MGKKKTPSYLENEARGVYRCPRCEHRWEQSLNWNAECPECDEIQGPVVVK